MVSPSHTKSPGKYLPMNKSLGVVKKILVCFAPPNDFVCVSPLSHLYQSRTHCGVMYASEGNNEGRGDSPVDESSSVMKRRIARAAEVDKKRIKSKGDRLLDDFVNKRMAGGRAFYGESLSEMDDEEYAKKVRDHLNFFHLPSPKKKEACPNYFSHDINAG